MRLKANEKAQWRQEQLDKQGGICPLCEREIPSGQATVDHDHSDGRCRMVLCRNCNGVEGRVNHWVRRTGVDPQMWLNNLMQYWNQDWSHNPQYPTHRNEVEKEISRLRKRMRRLKRAKTKAKYQAQINRLQRQLK